MVYNAMYPIKQNPYYVKDSRNFAKKKEDEESPNSSQPSLDNQNNGDNNDKVVLNRDRSTELQKEIADSKQAQATAITSRDANMKNSTVNIAQILKDFKNTAAAIGTPDTLNEEVKSYLALVETQVVKDEPNVKLIKSNLKNASSLLDGYITETLQRPSKVVENWLDALFLQQINYNFNQDEVNQQFLVKFPEKTQAKEEISETKIAENGGETAQANASTVIVPEDSQLKSLFIQAKKYSYANDSKKAMETFQAALNRSVEVKDKETQSKILYEIGKIYDNNDFLTQALTSYDKSLNTTQDTNVKTKAHFSMAQIYDDVAQFEPAINHYMSSISYAGETENFVAQSTSLTKIGNICSDKYNREAFDFYSEAKVIAQESKDTKVKGYVSSNTATAYSKFNEPQNALKYYSDAIKEYKEADSPSKIASNYKKAADVMISYGNPQKAKSLLEKALTSANQAGNVKLVAEINEQLSSM